MKTEGKPILDALLNASESFAIHTPGPWCEHNGQIYAENDPKGRTFALIPYYDHEPEQDANAQLIAAAPELFAALRWVIGDDSSDEPCIVAARAAIAKAEGSAR